MTSQLELNKEGEKYLIDQLDKVISLLAYPFVNYKKIIESANENIKIDKNYIDVPAFLSVNKKINRIEFTKDHLQFKAAK